MHVKNRYPDIYEEAAQVHASMRKRNATNPTLETIIGTSLRRLRPYLNPAQRNELTPILARAIRADLFDDA